MSPYLLGIDSGLTVTKAVAVIGRCEGWDRAEATAGVAAEPGPGISAEENAALRFRRIRDPNV